MSKMIAIGDEEFTFGFELVGIEARKLDELETLLQRGTDAGIIVLNQNDYETLPVKLKHRIDRSLQPIVVILSEEDVKGGNLREAVMRTLGVDLLK